MPQHIGMDVRGHIAVVTIGGPDDIFLTDAMLDELAVTVEALDQNDEVRAVIFTGGVPGVFIQHHDIAEIIAFSTSLQSSAEDFDADGPRPVMAADAPYAAVETFSKPTIAAINGHCMGGGLEFALCCDFRIAQTGPYGIGLVEAQFDCLPGGGGLTRMVRMLGYFQAIGPLLLGSVFSPEDAVIRGIVHSAADDPLTASLALAEKLVKRSPRAMRNIKKLARTASTSPLDEALQRERRLLFDLWSRPETLDRIEGFVRGDWTIALD